MHKIQNRALRLFFQNSKQHLILTLPILGTQMAQIGMTVADTIISGRYAASALAGVGLAASLYTPLALFLIGTSLASAPFIAGAVGARKLERIPQIVQQSLYLGGIILFFIIAAILATPMVFKIMNSPPEVAEISFSYLLALIPGLPGLLLYQIQRIVFESTGKARIALYIAVLGLIFNIIANIILVNGLYGFPELGAVGCGIATSLTFWLMAFLAYLFTSNYSYLKEIGIFKTFSTPNLAKIKELASIGLPIAGSIFVEVSLFSTIALFISDLGLIALASHQIAINIGGLIFSLPLSLGMAATILVGKSLGASHRKLARTKAINALFLSLFAAAFLVIFVYLFRYSIVGAYTNPNSPNSLEIINLAVSLLYIALIYQISDALQIAAAGSLRGYKDTKIVFFITLFSYWVIGLGTGHILGRGVFGAPALGVHGYWFGLLAGLSFAAILLVSRLLIISKKTIEKSQKHR